MQKAHDSTSLPGPKKKQAQALSQNIKWLADSFGIERVGFLTLTCGNATANGFKKISARREASRRFNSLLTGIIRHRYQCGVVVTERHKDGGIHFHLVVATGRDIRGGIDFDAVFPSKDELRRGVKPDYSTANEALKLEWKFWRERAESYGFGRCQMQPARSNGEALGFYVAKYISKSWEARCEDDKGGRLVRYFGRWSKAGHNLKPPWYANHGSLTPWARAWRECAKQSALLCKLDGFNLTEQNIRKICGRRWAWKATRKFNDHEFFVRGDEKLREAIEDHNTEARESWPGREIHVGNSRAEDWLPVEDWHRAEIENERERLAKFAEWEKVDGLRESLDLPVHRRHGTGD